MMKPSDASSTLRTFDALDPGDALTPADREPLSHLLGAGMEVNMLQAPRSDLAHLEPWSLACDGAHLPWPQRGT